MRYVPAALGGLFLFIFGLQSQGGEKNIQIERELVYGKAGGVELKLDLAYPKDAKGPLPTIVCVHGGGWRGGNRQQLDKLIQLLAQHNFVAATVSYRLTPKHIFPAQIEDCKEAVRWLRANADKYHIQPERIGAVGFSAGGHLVSLLGAADESAGLDGPGGNLTQSSRVQAVVSYFGPTDFMQKTWTKQVEDVFLVPFFGGTYEEKKANYRKGSPLAYVTKDDPPFLFFHGGKDPLVGHENSTKMAAKLKAAGVEASAVIFPNEGHGWAGETAKQTQDQSIRFFEKHLRK